MKKSVWVAFCLGAVLVFAGWFAFQLISDDPHEPRSVIPEEYKDIPIFEGLKLKHVRQNQYAVSGNRLREIYDFYLTELPKLGWKIEHLDTHFHETELNNGGTGGFFTRWRKNGFDGELVIGAGYNPLDDQTEVTFDKHSILSTSTWIHEIPAKVCIVQTADAGECDEINEKSRIEGIVSLINHAFDWEAVLEPRKNASKIDFGTLSVKVLYESDEEIYFVSEKGTKWMKPEREFFELTRLPRH